MSPKTAPHPSAAHGLPESGEIVFAVLACAPPALYEPGMPERVVYRLTAPAAGIV